MPNNKKCTRGRKFKMVLNKKTGKLQKVIAKNVPDNGPSVKALIAKYGIDSSTD